MKRCLTIAILCGLIPAVPAVAQSKLRLKSDKIPMSRDALLERGGRMNPIRAMLLKNVEAVAWDEATFAEVLDWLRAQKTEYGDVNIVPRWRALSAESVDEESIVSLKMEGTTVAKVLNEVLDQLSDLDPLTYIGVDNTLKVSTQSDFDRKLFTRVYDIQDIFVKIHNFRGAPEIDLEQQQQNQGGGSSSSGQAQVNSIFGQGGGGGGNDDDDDEDDDDSEREDELMEKIKLVVFPLTWDDNGGLGSMTVINRQLLVYNTLQVHEMLGGPMRHDE